MDHILWCPDPTPIEGSKSVSFWHICFCGKEELGQVLWSNWRTRILMHCGACTCCNTVFSHDHFPKTFKLSLWCHFLSWIWKLALQIWLALHRVLGTFQKVTYASSAFWFSTSESKFDAVTSPCHCDPFYHKSQFLSSISQKPVHIAGNESPAFDPTDNSQYSFFQILRICLPWQADYHVNLLHTAPAITKYPLGSLSSTALLIFCAEAFLGNNACHPFFTSGGSFWGTA